MPILSGIDKFGDFKLKQGMCDHCGKITARVDYLSFQLSGDIDPRARTLVSNINSKGQYVYNPMPKLGVTCGDYARFHRQVAHISSRHNS